MCLYEEASWKPSLVTHAYNSGTWEAEAEDQGKVRLCYKENSRPALSTGEAKAEEPKYKVHLKVQGQTK